MTKLKPCPFCGGKAQICVNLPENWKEQIIERIKEDGDWQLVKHGRWIEESDRWNHWHCSECGHVVGAAGKLGGKFCENCGARMDGEADAEK